MGHLPSSRQGNACATFGALAPRAPRTALETSFGVIGRSLDSSGDPRQCCLGDSGTGIIDTGASKSVIGEKRVNALLATLRPIHI